MTKFAMFTNEGFPIGFYAEDVHGERLRSVYGETPEPTEEYPFPAAPIIGEEPNPDCRIPLDAIGITDDQWMDFLSNQGLRKWVNGQVVAYDPPAPEPIVPDRVSRRQFRLQLIDAGLINQVETWVASQDIRTQAAYADSSSFLRADEMLQQGFAGMGFSAEQVDTFFTQAAAL